MKRPKYINKPFNRLPLKLRACYILILAGFTYKQIQQVSKASSRTISQAIKRACEENYNEK